MHTESLVGRENHAQALPKSGDVKSCRILNGLEFPLDSPARPPESPLLIIYAPGFIEPEIVTFGLQLEQVTVSRSFYGLPPTNVRSSLAALSVNVIQ